LILLSDTFWANTILVIHFLWAAWMIAGILLAYLGFLLPRLWKWIIFRTAHLVGLVATATTPFWADGLCPLTRWEWQLRHSATVSATGDESFIIHYIRELLFVDVDPQTLSLITGALTLSTVIIYFLRPPWRNYPTSR